MRTKKLLSTFRAEADSHRNGEPGRDHLINLILNDAEKGIVAVFDKFNKSLGYLNNQAIPAAPEPVFYKKHYRKKGELQAAIVLVLETTGKAMRAQEIAFEIKQMQLVEDTDNLTPNIATTMHREINSGQSQFEKVGVGRWALKKWNGRIAVPYANRKDGEA